MRDTEKLPDYITDASFILGLFVQMWFLFGVSASQLLAQMAVAHNVEANQMLI